MTPAERQAQFIEDFSIIEDRQERLSAVIDRARSRPRLPETERTAAHLVPGCQSQVWLLAEPRDGTLDLRFDCDSPLVKGLVALLCDLYSGCRSDDIIATEPTVLDELGLLRDLSPTRRTGLTAVRQRIVELAKAAGQGVWAAS